ncbi:MAG TPA: methyltransferase domain-containing protein [Methylocella sp.]|nr:methyltransferase domain-containing protein [Methylocella sp.]
MTDTPPRIFDTGLACRHLARALRKGGEDFLLAHAATEICERLTAIQRPFRAILDCGTPNARLAEQLAAHLQPPLLIRMMPLPAAANQNAIPSFAGEMENLALAPAKFDLAVSALALQAVNDLPGALLQLRLVLKPDGLFIGCLLGGASLQELRTALAAAETEIYGGVSPRIAPFADVRAMGGLLQRAGFALPVADSETLTVRYANMFGLIADLRAMGAANALIARRRVPVGKRFFSRAAEIYAQKFADSDSRVRATFELIYLSGWAPHESQQKPLAPGSAKMRLADALKTKPFPDTGSQ